MRFFTDGDLVPLLPLYSGGGAELAEEIKKEQEKMLEELMKKARKGPQLLEMNGEANAVRDRGVTELKRGGGHGQQLGIPALRRIGMRSGGSCVPQSSSRWPRPCTAPE